MKRIYKFSLAALFFTGIIAMYSCKKEKTTNAVPIVISDSVSIWTNVHVIDSNKMILNTSASNLAAGTYVFQNAGVNPTIQVGDVIVGITGEGYIRKVASVVINGNNITMETIQGTISDVFKKGSFSFNVDMNDMIAGKTSALAYSKRNDNLYQNGSLSIDLASADPGLSRLNF